MDRAADLVHWLSPEGEIIYVNESVCERNGYTKEEMVGMRMCDLDPELSPEAWRSHWHEIKERGYAVFESSHRTKSGETFPVEVVSNYVRHGDKEYEFAFMRDISKRTQAERALRQSEEYFRALIENASDIITVLDDSGTMLFNSPSCEGQLGYRPEELAGRNIFDFLHPDDIPQLRELFSDLLKEPGSQSALAEVRVHHKDGSWPIMEAEGRAAVAPSGDLVGILNSRDITERKRFEESLQAAKEYSEKLIQTANAMVIGLDREGKVTVCNEETERVTGYKRADIEGCDWFELVVPRDRYPGAWEVFSRLQAGDLPRNFENPILTKTGEERHILWQNNSLQEQGEARGTISFGVDITERKQAEEGLRASQVQLAAAMDLASLVNWEFDVDYRHLHFQRPVLRALWHNRGARRWLPDAGRNVCREDSFIRTNGIWLPRKWTGPYRVAIPIIEWTCEHRIVRRDGEIRHVAVRLGITKDEYGRTIKTHGANQDITERKRAETEKEDLQAQLGQAQKMETVGRLAGGIAHDFNNLLMAIIGNSSLALATMSPEDPNRELIADVKEVGERAAGLTRQILAFSRRQILKPEVLNLNEIILGMEPLLSRTLGEDIALHLVLEPDLQQTEVDRDQMGQVLMNLVINARDAMPEGGHLTIESANVRLDSKYSQILTRKSSRAAT